LAYIGKFEHSPGADAYDGDAQDKGYVKALTGKKIANSFVFHG
jgi:hypothetical protein